MKSKDEKFKELVSKVEKVKETEEGKLKGGVSLHTAPSYEPEEDAAQGNGQALSCCNGNDTHQHDTVDKN